MGDAPGVHDLEARVRRGRLTKRRILKDVPALRFGEGRDCTLPAALAIATGGEYDWLMGCSAAAFTTTIDETSWDPLAATPRDPETRTRMAAAAGVRIDPVDPPFDDEMRALVLDRLIEGVDTRLLPLELGIGGPEYGLIVGYDDEAPTFYLRTFFDKDDDLRRVGWDVFENAERGALTFADRTAAPDRARSVRDGIDVAIASADASDRALMSWAATLRDDTRWADSKHAGSAAFADHAMRAVLVDKRRAAARFLRAARGLFANAPGGDLLRAAESCGYAADAAAKGGLGPFDGSVAMRFIDTGHRRAFAKGLDAVRDHDREAREALASARSSIK